ncbi:MAG: bifunctional phosphoribosylaminoimidazolecarboxamide formyltransferase/IMP cyclohydrolase [Deltaproteobacteria bacterium]|nr:bifunctional phosphoribosylaminoimidazolecarboxamide formyltransferase/IMP cyclohydrolase [Nannocystaceae bacterium]
MNDVSPLRRALVSVSDKTGLELLARVLVESRVEVLSTGGTAKALAELGVAVVKVSEYTEAPEILGGRVKTLHPKIHGGILAMPTAEHEAELARHAIAPIDLVVVNLYPFRRTIAKPGCSFAEAIENIDIGGPTMVRAAAKNWGRVAVVVDPADYAVLAEAVVQHGGVPASLRRALARKAFAHTAAYDAAIAEYLAGWRDDGEPEPAGELPGFLMVGGSRRGELRYGENPHQAAAFYPTARGDEAPGLDAAVQLQGKPLSYNNLLDADAALALVRELAELGPAAAVIKHATPCGAALGQAGEAIAEVYHSAQQADAESSFGGIVALSQPCDGATAEKLAATFLEVVIAPRFDDDARARLAKKTNLRLLELPIIGASEHASLRVRSIAGGLLAQREDRIGVGPRQAELVAGPAPDDARWHELELAWRVVKHVRSNAIALVRGGVTIGLGGGQTSRVEAVRQALTRAGEHARGATLASDAFFPFRDSIDALADAGVAAIIQPGGSVRDEEVVAAAREHGITMLLTRERHFRH